MLNFLKIGFIATIGGLVIGWSLLGLLLGFGYHLDQVAGYSLGIASGWIVAALAIHRAHQAERREWYESKLSIQDAVRHLILALREDSEYAWGWVCNIAMAQVDEGVDHETANRGACRFLQILTANYPEGERGLDMTQSHYFISLEEQWAKNRERQDIPRDQIEQGWFLLVNPEETEERNDTIVYITEENGQKIVNFNVVDGAAMMPLWDVKESSKFYPIDLG